VKELVRGTHQLLNTELRTVKGNQQARGTHQLLDTEGGTIQDSKRKPASKRLTNCQEPSELQFRTAKESQ
jgi:hypothetical protein